MIRSLKSALYLGVVSLLNHKQSVKLTKFNTYVNEYIQSKGYKEIADFHQSAPNEDKRSLIDYLYSKGNLDIQAHEKTLSDFLLFYQIPTRFFYFSNISSSMLEQIDSQQKTTPKWHITSNVIENKPYQQEDLFLPIGIFSFNNRTTKFVLVQPKKTTFTVLKPTKNNASQTIISSKTKPFFNSSYDKSFTHIDKDTSNKLPENLKVKEKINNGKQLNLNNTEIYPRNLQLMDYAKNNTENSFLTNPNCSDLKSSAKISNTASNETNTSTTDNNFSYLESFDFSYLESFDFSYYHILALTACASVISYYALPHFRHHEPLRTSMLYHLMATQLQHQANRAIPPAAFIAEYGGNIAAVIYDAIVNHGDIDHLAEFM